MFVCTACVNDLLSSQAPERNVTRQELVNAGRVVNQVLRSIADQQGSAKQVRNQPKNRDHVCSPLMPAEPGPPLNGSAEQS